MLFFRNFRSMLFIPLGILILVIGLSLSASLESQGNDKSGNKDSSEKFREIWRQAAIQSAKDANIDVGDLLDSDAINLETGSTLTSEKDDLVPLEIQQVCGNGIVEFPERCEPPNTDFCDEFCQWNPETTITKIIPLVCSNNSTADLLEVSYELTAIPQDTVIENQPVQIQFTGIANFSEELLNGALDMFPTLTEIRADSMNATAVVRSGATGGGPVLLNPAVTLPHTFPIPVVNDPALCAAEGYSAPCVLEPIAVPLNSQTATFTPGAAGTNILIGWDESLLPPVAFGINDPTGPNGARVRIFYVIRMGLECYMAELNDNGIAVPVLDSDLLAIPIESDTTGVDDVPSNIHSVSAAPNPFNPITTVSYTVPKSGNVILDVYDTRGAWVKNLVNENKASGTYSISWNGTDSNGKRVPSGVYALRISSKAGSTTSKITMIK